LSSVIVGVLFAGMAKARPYFAPSVIQKDN